ncbi:Nucleoside diphosphate kinase 6 [Coemansia sp. Benny D115]|nr:Nucleoside diphosphate kinase 6 [Coemansia sp. Benny D115]
MIAHAAQRSLVQQAQALRICRHNVDFKVQVRRLAHMAPKVAAIAAAPVGAEPEAAEEERTLALLKPDLLADPGMVAQVLAEIRLQQGITIVQHKELQWTEDDASKFYAEHQGRFFYERLVGYMSSGPLVALELQGFGVISRY